MKKVALILLAIGLVISSCKKETPQPTAPAAPLQDTTLPDTTGNGGGTGGGTTGNNNLGRPFSVTTDILVNKLDSIVITYWPTTNGVWDGTTMYSLVIPYDSLQTMLPQMTTKIKFSALDIVTNKVFGPAGILNIKLYLNTGVNASIYNMYELNLNDTDQASSDLKYMNNNTLLYTE